jgi:hypothetical protein
VENPFRSRHTGHFFLWSSLPPPRGHRSQAVITAFSLARRVTARIVRGAYASHVENWGSQIHPHNRRSCSDFPAVLLFGVQRWPPAYGIAYRHDGGDTPRRRGSNAGTGRFGLRRCLCPGSAPSILFFAPNLMKVVDGGWVPLLFAGCADS